MACRELLPLSNLLPSAVVVDFADALFNAKLENFARVPSSSVVDELAVVGSQPYIQPSYVPSVTLIFDLAMVSVSAYKGRLSSTVAPVSGEQFQQSKSRRRHGGVGFFFFLSVDVLFVLRALVDSTCTTAVCMVMVRSDDGVSVASLSSSSVGILYYYYHYVQEDNDDV